MKLALVNGQREEARPDLSGECPWCAYPVIAKCGEIRVRHWAHQRSSECDPWWENETEWHRNWKDQFPVDWQECIHRAEDGEKHIADVRTRHGWVLEFQHSSIKPEERKARDKFYPKLIWVVDGTRRKRDVPEFRDALERGIPVGANSQVRRITPGKCKLLGEWIGSTSQVLVDFGEANYLWWLLAKYVSGPIYVGRFGRKEFIQTHLGSESQLVCAFEELVRDLGKLASRYEAWLQVQSMRGRTHQSLPSFQAHAARKRIRTRF